MAQKNLEISMLLDFYGEMLTAKQREMIGYYYNDDLSLAEIAENEGITRQGVRDSIKRAETQLFEMESCLKIAERHRNMEIVAKQADTILDEILTFNLRYGGSREIDERTRAVKEILNDFM